MCEESALKRFELCNRRLLTLPRTPRLRTRLPRPRTRRPLRTPRPRTRLPRLRTRTLRPLRVRRRPRTLLRRTLLHPLLLLFWFSPWHHK